MHSFCPDIIDSREDVFMGGFFGDHHGIYLSHDFDENFARRYVDSAYEMSHYPSPIKPKVLKRRFNLESKERIDSTSDEAFSFHLKDDSKFLKRKGHTMAELIHRYHAVLHDKCD
mmetsp:Transcript_28971/g.43763  ORF Transcript_28971/g.43763 Transcript_28971/m.43763 type:complete len:115 (-) Transcript_28971:1367-1711(-)